MKTIKLDEFCDLLNGKVWQKGEMFRIYIQTDRTAKAYLNFDFNASVRESGEVEIDEQGYIKDAGLYVYSNCESQGRQWNINRSKQIKHELMKQISAITGCEICETWQEVC